MSSSTIHLAESEYPEKRRLSKRTRTTALNLLQKPPRHQVSEALACVYHFAHETVELGVPKALVGQRAVQATCKIQKGETVAIYEGKLRFDLTVEERARVGKCQYVCNIVADSPVPEDKSWQEEDKQWKPDIRGILYRIDPLDELSGVADEHKDATGNLSMYINDFRVDVRRAPTADEKKRINVEFVGATYSKSSNEGDVERPVMLVVATRDIQEHEYLWVDYGDGYWRH